MLSALAPRQWLLTKPSHVACGSECNGGLCSWSSARCSYSDTRKVAHNPLARRVADGTVCAEAHKSVLDVQTICFGDDGHDERNWRRDGFDVGGLRCACTDEYRQRDGGNDTCDGGYCCPDKQRPSLHSERGLESKESVDCAGAWGADRRAFFGRPGSLQAASVAA